MVSKKTIILLIIAIISGSFFSGYTILYFLSEDPVFELPIHDDVVENVTGIQTFHEEHGGKLHGGFDFELKNNTEIIAPIDGIISSVHKHKMSNDLWIVDVFISINLKWEMFIAFEPCIYDEDVIDDQLKEISVKVGDQVRVGDKLGILTPVKDSDFPHIHWNVIEKGWFPLMREDRSPYDYCSKNAKEDLDYLCEKFDKPPSYD